jgi:hypothetical protein
MYLGSPVINLDETILLILSLAKQDFFQIFGKKANKLECDSTCLRDARDAL